MVNLLDFNHTQLALYCESLGEKPFRAKQILRWVHQFGVSDFSLMTDLSGALREKLHKEACVQAPHIIQDHTALDGTRKWLLDVGKGNAIEMVFIPEDNRGTLCVSTQAGCAVNCRFCSTGKQGFNRNLTTGEILGQLWLAEHLLRQTKGLPKGVRTERQITNVVMMGMGEPLLNFEPVVVALQVMLDDYAYGLSRRRVTVSTSGVVPAMDKLGLACPVALAVSLHAPTDRLRNDLVPLNKKYPLSELLAACRRYLVYAPRDFITFEYCMLAGVNDRLEDARALLALVKDVPCKLNLIPFNPFVGSGLERSSKEAIHAFAQTISDQGIVVTIRKTRGDDIDAACGQLAGEVVDRTRVVMRMEKK